jgi:hypothetical protein
MQTSRSHNVFAKGNSIDVWENEGGLIERVEENGATFEESSTKRANRV